MDTAAVVQTVHFSAIFTSGYVRLNYTVWLDLFKSEQSACTAIGHCWHNIVLIVFFGPEILPIPLANDPAKSKF